LAFADRFINGADRGAFSICARVGFGAIYLYDFLMNILGISAFYHDAAACLLVNGNLISAAQEERFTGIKHDPCFPKNSIKYCLARSGLRPEQIDHVVFYDKPFLKFERLLETYLSFAPRGFKSFISSAPVWLKDKLFQKSQILSELHSIFGKSVKWEERLLFSEHHMSHAASAFFPSPFANAAVLTMDGVGEWTTTSLAIGRGNELSIEKEIHFPHSIGLLYSAMTYYTGFKVNSGEYKLMGLAPYGRPIYSKLIKDFLIDIKEDGSFHLNMSYFSFCTELKMTGNKFNKLFGGEPRAPESPITQKDMDLAASIQEVLEEVLVKLARNIAVTTNEKNLCLAGGVALNCVANGRLLQEGLFENIWIQPASGDAGGAVGAAFAAYYLHLKSPRKVNGGQDGMSGSLLGPEYSNSEIEHQLNKLGALFTYLDDTDLIDSAAIILAAGKTIGWHQGRMEFGPRALGSRSILADARALNMQKQLNLKIKYRESFRPFAPSILSTDKSDWFDLSVDSPYMLMVAKVKENRRLPDDPKVKNLIGISKLNVPRSSIPAVTHVDYTARVQTVNNHSNPRYFALLQKFKELTGCPILVNTSFNVRGRPIVESPSDAFKSFMATDLDCLFIGNYRLQKQDQNEKLIPLYKEQLKPLND
jgi:carbamoyltransferase